MIARAVEGLTPGVYHYAPILAGLEQFREAEIPARLLTYLFMGAPAAEAACVLVLTAVVSRSLGKYGDRGYRYLMFEAGHVAQNTNLAAVDQGLGACNLGGFFDDELAALLTLDIDLEIPRTQWLWVRPPVTTATNSAPSNSDPAVPSRREHPAEVLFVT